VKQQTKSVVGGNERFPFHYGGEADQYTFYRIPKRMFDDPILKQLSTDAKVLYGLMLDRMGLSLRNGWFDEEGRVYIYFSVEEIMAMLGCANAKCTKLLQELDSENGIGLITRVKQGLCKPDVIYVHKCVSRISESNARTFENQISGGLKNTSQEIAKSNANNNYQYNTYFSDTESIFSERAEPVREREVYREMVLENIDYDILIADSKFERTQIDEIVDLMVDTICTTQAYIMIGGDRKPAEVVKSRFLKLDAGHIQFVLDCLKKNTSKVRNIRKYLLSVLYNASMTIDNYYSALVNHDLYGG
jgi:hypothetical protein